MELPFGSGNFYPALFPPLRNYFRHLGPNINTYTVVGISASLPLFGDIEAQYIIVGEGIVVNYSGAPGAIFTLIRVLDNLSEGLGYDLFDNSYGPGLIGELASSVPGSSSQLALSNAINIGAAGQIGWAYANNIHDFEGWSEGASAMIPGTQYLIAAPAAPRQGALMARLARIVVPGVGDAAGRARGGGPGGPHRRGERDARPPRPAARQRTPVATLEAATGRQLSSRKRSLPSLGVRYSVPAMTSRLCCGTGRKV